MKKSKNYFLFLLATLFTLTFTACSDDEGGEDAGPATGITVDPSTLNVTTGALEIITATLQPSGATGDIIWSTSDAAVATVANGVVTGVAPGTASIVAATGTYTATCEVTVANELIVIDHPSLQGSDYYVIQLDEAAFGNIESEVAHDFRPDGEEGGKNLFVWDGTFVANTPIGNNMFDLEYEWVSLAVEGSAGWSGAGYNVGSGFGTIDMTALSASPSEYYLHLAFKTDDANASYLMILNDGTSEVKFAIGGAYTDNGVVYPSLASLTSDGEWNSIDIPVTSLNTLGIFYNQTFSNVNILAFLAGGTQGTTLDIDAAFFYKK